MSGTGNSYRVSEWIKENNENNGIKTKIISITKKTSNNIDKDIKYDFLGIVMPTHGFTAPWLMIKFVTNLPRVKQTKAFVIATRAGGKFGKVYTPGICGTATFIISIILAVKGYIVKGVKSVDMPSNWMSLHPSFSLTASKAIINRTKPKVINFANKIIANKRVWITLNNLYELIFSIVLFPISVAYICLGRFFLAKLFFANEKCNACGICVTNCPVNAIKLSKRKKPYPFWKYNCESCMRCMCFCPQNAIEAGHSWGVILYFITMVPVSIYLLSWLINIFPVLEVFDNKLISGIINIIYYFMSLFISYYLFNLLLRIPIINKLFTYTTFTHYYKLYREPDTKVSDFKKYCNLNN